MDELQPLPTPQYLQGKVFSANGRYLVLTADNVEIEIFPTDETRRILRQELDRGRIYTFTGRYETYRHQPYMLFKDAGLVEDAEFVEDFDIEVKVFRVYKNNIEKYGEKYNYVLAKVRDGRNEYRLKINFTTLPTTELVCKLVTFRIVRDCDKLVATQMLEVRDIPNR